MKLNSNIVKAVIVTTVVLTLSACITSRVEDTREANTGIDEGEAVVIMAKSYHLGNETEEKYIRCVEDGRFGKHLTR